MGAIITFWPHPRQQDTLDELRVGDLYRIADHLRDGHDRSEQLPQRLPAYIPTPYGRDDDRPVVSDPVTHRRFQYGRNDDNHYSLCAVFDNSTMEKIPSDSSAVRFWAHPAGRKCFEFDVRVTPPLADVPDPLEPNEF